MNERRINLDRIDNISFFTPTTKLKELIILEHIENNPNVTQKELAQVANAAPSMINAYIDEYEEKGYMIREYISSKVVNYKITPEGIQRKNYLSITYIRELMRLYILAKESVEKFLQGIEDKGFRNILLYGAGEVAETVLSVIRDKDNISLNVVAIIDDDVEKQGQLMMGCRVVGRDSIMGLKHDAVVITSYTFEDRIRERLEEVGYDRSMVVRFFGGGISHGR